MLTQSTPSPSILQAYEYTQSHDKHVWAWEFLRRNPDYIKDFTNHQHSIPLCDLHPSGARVYTLTKPCDCARKWGLQFFPDPAHHHHKIDVFWEQDICSDYIGMLNGSGPHGDFNLSDFCCDKAVLIHCGTELICLRHHLSSVILKTSGLSTLAGQIAVTFQIHGLAALKKALLNLNCLRTITLPDLPLIDQSWCMARQRLRDTLIALDAQQSGWSYRDIAFIFYGETRVKEEWIGVSRSLKDRIRRLVQRGEALMNGDYVSLL